MGNVLMRSFAAFAVAAAVLVMSPPRAGFARSGCELVRLYPGYPGYRGVLEDSFGGGDVACLEDLMRQDPGFDPALQDAKNLAAGRRVGATGIPPDWTWETWMAVEAARGLAPHCHICVYVNGITPPPVRHDDAPGDALDALGTYGGRALATDYVNQHDLPGWLINRLPADDQVRALASMFNPGVYLGASEIVEFANSFFDGMNTRGQFVNAEKAWCNAVEQGGYVPASRNMSEQDQLGLMLEAAWAISPFWSQSAIQSAQQIIYERFQEWESESLKGQTADGFGAWYADNGGRTVLTSC